MRKLWFLRGFAFIAGFILLGGFVVMSLWNWLIPDIFGLDIINFAQAIGLLVLSKVLFGGFRGGHWGGFEGRRNFWKHRMAERLEKMSPEERRQFKDRMQRRWGRRNFAREERDEME